MSKIVEFISSCKNAITGWTVAKLIKSTAFVVDFGYFEKIWIFEIRTRLNFTVCNKAIRQKFTMEFYVLSQENHHLSYLYV